MSAGYIGKTTNSPVTTRATTARTTVEESMGEIPGEIMEFDPATQTAKIQPLFQLVINGTQLRMPPLEQVPVRFHTGGNGALTYPVKVGDKVTLRPQMRSTDLYHTDASEVPNDARYCDISDMEAHLDGGESVKEPIQSFDASRVHLRFAQGGEYGIRGNAQGEVTIEITKWAVNGAAGNFVDILTQVVEKLAMDGLNVKYGSSAGVGTHELQFKSDYAALAAQLRSMVL